LPGRRETGEWGFAGAKVRSRFKIVGADSEMLALTFIGYELDRFVSIGGG
jgi:hypothetical protein